MTEKEQKIREYLTRKKKLLNFVRFYGAITPKEILLSLDKQGFTKEMITSDIRNYNSLLSKIRREDITEQNLIKKLCKIWLKLTTLRRIYIINGIREEEIPKPNHLLSRNEETLEYYVN